MRLYWEHNTHAYMTKSKFRGPAELFAYISYNPVLNLFNVRTRTFATTDRNFATFGEAVTYIEALAALED